MAEYIDREALLKTIFPYDGVDKSKYAINAKAVEKAIKGATTADVVEVVRCKDCIHFKTDTDYCKEHNKGYCEWDSTIKSRKHFCSYGERKEQE